VRLPEESIMNNRLCKKTEEGDEETIQRKTHLDIAEVSRKAQINRDDD